jgi:hypothetical protein
VLGGFDDFIAWHGTRMGRFSVRSAYHTEWRHAFNGVTCRSLIAGTPLNNIIWKILWHLDVSAKVKNLLLAYIAWGTGTEGDFI